MFQESRRERDAPLRDSPRPSRPGTSARAPRAPSARRRHAPPPKPPPLARYTRWAVWIIAVAVFAIGGAAVKQRFWPARTNQTAPSFQIRTIRGEPLALSDFIGRKHVLLVFYRGSFSPTSTERLAELQSIYAQVQALNGELIAVSTESRNTALKTAAELRLAFPIVSDLQLTELYKTYNPETLLTNPAVILIDKKGTIRWKRIGRGPLDLPPVSEILARLKSL